MATVASATVTQTDHTKGPRNIYDLMTTGSGGGYTVVGGFSGDVTQFGMVAYRSVQADSNNSGTVYIGDAKIANDNSRQGVALLKTSAIWQRDNECACASLQNVWVRCGTDNDKFNIMVETA